MLCLFGFFRYQLLLLIIEKSFLPKSTYHLSVTSRNSKMKNVGPTFKKLTVSASLLAAGLIALKLALSSCIYGDCKQIDSDALRLEVRSLEEKLASLRQANNNQYCTKAEAKSELIDEKLWSQGDTKVLSGCWDLQDNVQMVRNFTIPVKLTKWRVCFDNQLNIGHQEMMFSDGAICSNAKIKGEFIEEGSSSALLLDDLAAVSCTIGSVFHRQLQCRLTGGGKYAECKSRSFSTPSPTDMTKRWTRWGEFDIILRKAN